ncbi:MAG: hypothetical protein YK1309IOTA_2200003, partial [Marine Group I thaumarchaeote]
MKLLRFSRFPSSNIKNSYSKGLLFITNYYKWIIDLKPEIALLFNIASNVSSFSKVGSSSHTGLKILLVDDNKSILTMLTEFFKLRGDQYQVETADNGAAALDKYSKFKPAVVVLDLAMPVMSGAETLNKLLKLDKDAVVIISSASESKQDIEHYLEKGAQGFVPKPCSPQLVLEKIRDVLIFSRLNKELVTLFSIVTG